MSPESVKLRRIRQAKGTFGPEAERERRGRKWRGDERKDGGTEKERERRKAGRICFFPQRPGEYSPDSRSDQQFFGCVTRKLIGLSSRDLSDPKLHTSDPR